MRGALRALTVIVFLLVATRSVELEVATGAGLLRALQRKDVERVVVVRPMRLGPEWSGLKRAIVIDGRAVIIEGLSGKMAS